MITNENDTRTKTFGAINNLSLDTITQMAEQEWQRFSGLNPALKAEKTGRLSIEVVTIVASVTKIGKVSKAVNFIDELDAVSNVAKLAGKVIKPVVNAGSKSVKFVLTEGVQLIKRYDISFKVDGNTLYCGFPGKVSISIVDKLKKKTPDEIRKIPTDENGNRLVEIDNEPVLIGTKEGLEKVGENLNNVFLKNIDNTITKLKSKAKFELNGTGIYNDVKADILINTSEYTKRYVAIDSIDIYKEKGVESGNITGYSKELDNHKTQIKMGSFSDALFGSRRTIRDVLGEEYNYDSSRNYKYSRYIWYRKGAKYAYITDKEEIRYPVSDVLKKRFFNCFTFSFIILLVINRIVKYIFNFNLI